MTVNAKKRIVVWAPTNVGYLLNLVSEYLFINRSELYERVWQAGLESYLGLNEDEASKMIPRPLPFGAVPPEDVQKLVNEILGNA
jgi:hypothetical protein